MHAEAQGCVIETQLGCRGLGATSQPVSWRPLGSTTLTLTKQYPMTGNGARSLSMRLAPTQGAPGGIINTGFWGMPVQAGHQYELSAYLRDPSSDAVCLRGPLHSMAGSGNTHMDMPHRLGVPLCTVHIDTLIMYILHSLGIPYVLCIAKHSPRTCPIG